MQAIAVDCQQQACWRSVTRWHAEPRSDDGPESAAAPEDELPRSYLRLRVRTYTANLATLIVCKCIVLPTRWVADRCDLVYGAAYAPEKWHCVSTNRRMA